MNAILRLYRQAFPADTRTDDRLTLDLAKERPDWLDLDPTFKADFDRYSAQPAPETPGMTDYARQAAGEVVRGFAGVFGEFGKSVSTGRDLLDQAINKKLGIPFDVVTTMSSPLEAIAKTCLLYTSRCV